MWNTGNGLILAGGLLLSQSVFSAPPLPPIGTSAVLSSTPSRVADILSDQPSSSENNMTVFVKTPSAPVQSHEKDDLYRESVGSFRNNIAENISVKVAGFKLGILRGWQGQDFSGSRVGVRYALPINALPPQSSANIELSSGKVEIKARFDF